MLVNGTGAATSDPIATIKERYEQKENDEFLKPIIVNPKGTVQDNDTLVFFDFRSGASVFVYLLAHCSLIVD